MNLPDIAAALVDLRPEIGERTFDHRMLGPALSDFCLADKPALYTPHFFAFAFANRECMDALSYFCPTQLTMLVETGPNTTPKATDVLETFPGFVRPMGEPSCLAKAINMRLEHAHLPKPSLQEIATAIGSQLPVSVTCEQWQPYFQALAKVGVLDANAQTFFTEGCAQGEPELVLLTSGPLDWDAMGAGSNEWPVDRAAMKAWGRSEQDRPQFELAISAFLERAIAEGRQDLAIASHPSVIPASTTREEQTHAQPIHSLIRLDFAQPIMLLMQAGMDATQPQVTNASSPIEDAESMSNPQQREALNAMRAFSARRSAMDLIKNLASSPAP